MIPRILSPPAGHLLLILLLGVLAYSNSFGVPFVLDDFESITRNESIRDLGNFLPGGSGYDFHPRRWVGYFSFALNHHFGGLNVFGYHLVNLFIHLATALLVYALTRLSFRTPVLAASRLAPRAGSLALLAALLFVVHPVQTQAVTYVVQRLTSLCTLFYLLALVLYLAARLHSEKNLADKDGQGIRAWGDRKTFFLLGTACVTAVLAMFTKEIAFTLPLAAALYEWSFFRGPWRRRLTFLAPLLPTLAIIPLFVALGRELGSDGTFQQTLVDIPRRHYLFTQFPVILTYLRLLILPIHQNLDYDFPVYTRFFAPQVILSFLLLAAGIAVALRLFAATRRGAVDPAVRLATFGIVWFFLTLSVESSLVPLADVIFEHRLYLPSVGAFTAFAVAIFLLREKLPNTLPGRLPLLAGAVVILVLTAASWQRNRDWRSEVSIWQDTVGKSPNKSRPWYNLGTHLTDAGRPAEAIPALARAVTLDPRYAEAWHNLGRSYLLSNQAVKAVVPLRTAVSLKPEMDNAVVNLAVALLQTGDPRGALPLLEKTRQRFPEWPEVRLNLGIAYLGIGQTASARRELAALQRIAPALARELAEMIARTESRLQSR